MLPSFTRLSIGVPPEEIPLNVTNDDQNRPVFTILPKHVWMNNTQDNSIPFEMDKRLGVITQICEYILGDASGSVDPSDMKLLTIMSEPSWKLTSLVPDKMQLVYYQPPGGASVIPRWKGENGRLAIDMWPGVERSDVSVWALLTYEWMQLPVEDGAISLAEIVHRFVPSVAWKGFSRDLHNICGQNEGCLTDYINKRLIDKLVPSSDISKDGEQDEQNEADDDDDEMDDDDDEMDDDDDVILRRFWAMNDIPLVMLRYWVRAAFEHVPKQVWNEKRVTDKIFDMPELLTSAYVQIPSRRDAFFVDSLRKILQAAAAPGGVAFQRDLLQFEDMFQEHNNPTHQNKRNAPDSESGSSKHARTDNNP